MCIERKLHFSGTIFKGAKPYIQGQKLLPQTQCRGCILCKSCPKKSSSNVANYSVLAAAVFELQLTVCIRYCC